MRRLRGESGLRNANDGRLRRCASKTQRSREDVDADDESRDIGGELKHAEEIAVERTSCTERAGSADRTTLIRRQGGETRRGGEHLIREIVRKFDLHGM